MNKFDYLGLDGYKQGSFLLLLEELSVSRAIFEDPLFIWSGQIHRTTKIWVMVIYNHFIVPSFSFSFGALLPHLSKETPHKYSIQD